MIVAYDGSGYLGWQSQPGGKTVQDVIEAALEKILKQKVRIHGASRTDSGVHAWGQVCHFDTDSWPHGAQKLHKALQSLLPADILIRSLSKTSDDFHARFSAKGKRYIYKIKLGETTPFEGRFVLAYARHAIDFQLLKSTFKLFEGRHNFESFAGNVNKEETPIKVLKRVSASKKDSYITITLEGSGFLYKMCRGLVGAALEVARGKLDKKRIKELLRKPQRTHEVVTAPAKGLILDKVFYK